MCEVKCCRKETALTCIGVELCQHHYEQHCEGLDLITTKGLLSFCSGVAVLLGFDDHFIVKEEEVVLIDNQRKQSIKS